MTSAFNGHPVGIEYKRPGYVDIILGLGGVLYRKSFFRDGLVFDYDNGPPDFKAACYFVDDMWFSGHLERLGVRRWVILGKQPKTTHSDTSTHALALSRQDKD